MNKTILPKTITRMIGLIAIVTFAGVATACTKPNTTSAQATANSTASSAGIDHSKMGHGGMKQGEMQHEAMGHNMDLGPVDADFDLRFIDAMIPHHEGAVIMAKEVLTKSQRPELKKMAQAIIAAQDQEIAQMQAWRKAWYPKAPDKPVMWHGSMNHQMAMDEATLKAMRMDMDLGAADADFDKRFIDAMIPHHEGALTMAKDLQSKTKRPELKKLAQDILSSQKAEIAQMKQWHKTWYGL
jgi:uncharacterized protein (DUF305 family)